MKTTNKVWFGLLFVALLALVAILAGVFYAGGDGPDDEWRTLGAIHSAGAYQVRLKLMPEQPKIGQNRLTLAIRDG